MTRRTFTGAGLGRQRLNAHALHERADVASVNVHTIFAQLVAQHARTHEGMLQVQLVDLEHQRQIGRADRPGQVIHRAPAHAQQPGLARDGELMVTVDHRFALSNPALVSAPSKKSFSSVS